MPDHPPIRPVAWRPAVVQALANVLGATDPPCLTGTEINRYLTESGIPFAEGANKRTRLANALLYQQTRDSSSETLIRFLSEAMQPARYLADQHRFEALRDRLNEPLSLIGLTLSEQGTVTPLGSTATTLDEVAQLAGRLQAELRRRRVHSEVLRYCDEEIVRKSLFHAVFEATKGVSERLRQMTGLTSDASALVDQGFSAKNVPRPRIQINAYHHESDISEQNGFMNLLKGIFGTFRNPAAHIPRATDRWRLTEPDALDLLSILSLVHRRLDTATLNPPDPTAAPTQQPSIRPRRP